MASRRNIHPGQAKTIAFIGQKGIPAEFIGTSGVEFYVEQKATQLQKRGHHVICYVRNWATPKNIRSYQGVQIIHLPSINTKRLDTVSHSLLASLHACFTDADTVWYHASGPALFSFLPRIFGKNVVVTIHTLEWKREKWGPLAQAVLKFGERVGVASADTLFAVSQDIADHLKNTYKKDVLVDEPVVKKKKHAPPSIITDKYGLKGNDYILYLGRFVPEKRVEWLINAYKEIQRKGMKLVLAGGASFTDGYEKKLRAMSVGDKNILFTGWVFGKEKEELLSNCRFFVLPSSLEGNPVIIYEAQQYDRLCIVPDVLKRTIPRSAGILYFQHDNRVDFCRKVVETIKKQSPYAGLQR